MANKIKITVDSTCDMTPDTDYLALQPNLKYIHCYEDEDMDA